MAILKSVVDVNNGNTGWTNADVIDALETVFANLGFNGGSSLSGVPQEAPQALHIPRQADERLG